MSKQGRISAEEVGELLAAMGQLVRRMRAEAKAGELTFTQVGVMARLEAEAMTAADLARAESMKPQSMGAALAQMEEQGLVRRKPHPSDARQILYELTPAALEGRFMRRLVKRDWLMGAIAKLDREEQQLLLSVVPTIKRLAES